MILELRATSEEVSDLFCIMRNEGVDVQDCRSVARWILDQCGVEVKN